MKSRVNSNYMAIVSRAVHGYHISLAYHISRAISMKKRSRLCHRFVHLPLHFLCNSSMVPGLGRLSDSSSLGFATSSETTGSSGSGGLSCVLSNNEEVCDEAAKTFPIFINGL